jgi:cell division protein FtsI/penicillin-binding protein 2
MVPLRIAGALVIAALAITSAFSGNRGSQSFAAQNSSAAAKSLFSQSAVLVLEREFPSSDISYLLFDARNGTLLSSRWDDPSKPIPLGSLVKPFTALAYGETHENQFPTHVCRGEASGCWQVRPHGKLDLVSAIAVSCNSYFRALAEDLTGEQLIPIAKRFGFDPPDPALSGPALMGLGDRWRIAPIKMGRAYLELYRRRDQPVVREVLAGMAQSARSGTGKGVGDALKNVDALVKTGTAPCTHTHAAPGDGFVVAMVPANQPELLLLVRVHSVPGATASLTAGRMLHRLEE